MRALTRNSGRSGHDQLSIHRYFIGNVGHGQVSYNQPSSDTRVDAVMLVCNLEEEHIFLEAKLEVIVRNIMSNSMTA
jgi:hypothetical protein